MVLVGLAALLAPCGAEGGAHVATLDGGEAPPVALRVGRNVSAKLPHSTPSPNRRIVCYLPRRSAGLHISLRPQTFQLLAHRQLQPLTAPVRWQEVEGLLAGNEPGQQGVSATL
jgi:hypothetical protein